METDEQRAQMSTAEINDLPDSAFAYIEPGGHKDDEGKTVPRSLRHFPIHDAEHVRNALARIAQGAKFGEEALPKVLAAAKRLGVEVQDNQRARRRKPRHRAVPLVPEVRHFAADGLEVRSATKTDEIIVTGEPIVYETPYAVTDIFGEFEERMMPGVASGVLERGADVRFLFNHDGLPLARSTAGTMRLMDGPKALRFEARLDARQQLANDLAIAIERGDITQMSCGFIVARDLWDEAETHRTVLEFAELLDVSAVTYPASPTTSIDVARRMALEVPIESRARLRRIYAELRAGKVLSQENQDRLVAAATALHAVLDAAGFDPQHLIGREDGDEVNADGSDGAASGDAVQDDDGSMPSEAVIQDDPAPAMAQGARSKILMLRAQMKVRELRRNA